MLHDDTTDLDDTPKGDHSLACSLGDIWPKIKSSTYDKSFFGLIEIAFNRYILFQGLSINSESCYLIFVGAICEWILECLPY
jgi:hypothetical protein